MGDVGATATVRQTCQQFITGLPSSVATSDGQQGCRPNRWTHSAGAVLVISACEHVCSLFATQKPNPGGNRPEARSNMAAGRVQVNHGSPEQEGELTGLGSNVMWRWLIIMSKT